MNIHYLSTIQVLVPFKLGILISVNLNGSLEEFHQVLSRVHVKHQ